MMNRNRDRDTGLGRVLFKRSEPPRWCGRSQVAPRHVSDTRRATSTLAATPTIVGVNYESSVWFEWLTTTNPTVQTTGNNGTIDPVTTSNSLRLRTDLKPAARYYTVTESESCARPVGPGPRLGLGVPRRWPGASG
eukprot:3337098-Rhodomonas_salina.2